MASTTEKPVQLATSTSPSAVRAAPVQVAPATEPSRENSLPDSSSSSMVKKAVEIISQQSGVPVSDLRDDTRFDDIGIDSLLSLMITSLFTEELGVTADSSFFLENSTVADVKKFIETSTLSAMPTEPQAAELKEIMPVIQATISPVSQQEVQLQAPRVPQAVSSTAYNEVDIDANDKFSGVLKIISEEAGVALEQLADDVSLADIGVDSLLSLMIGSRLRDELEIDVDNESMMSTLDTVGALREALFPVNASLSSSVRSDDTSPMAEAPELITPPSELDFPSITESVPPTTSVILQGNPRTAKNVLFFFPDGSGLASSYASLPRINEHLVVYGLNSPYLKHGSEMNCTWDGMVGSYIAEVRRRQPCGPYSFAGWSAGGILSYRAAQILMGAGEIVKDLIILDSPPPENLKTLPEHFFEYCSTSGLFGGQGVAPSWLIRHFRSINRVLSTYFAAPLTVSTLRKVNILWACESSVTDAFHPQPDDPEDMKFLTEKRTDFTAGAWGRLFPDVPVYVDRAVGRHHWNILVS